MNKNSLKCMDKSGKCGPMQTPPPVFNRQPHRFAMSWTPSPSFFLPVFRVRRHFVQKRTLSPGRVFEAHFKTVPVPGDGTKGASRCWSTFFDHAICGIGKWIYISSLSKELKYGLGRTWRIQAKDWGCSAIWLEHRPVTAKVAGSTPVNPASHYISESQARFSGAGQDA